jgi:hypothetical protein
MGKSLYRVQHFNGNCEMIVDNIETRKLLHFGIYHAKILYWRGFRRTQPETQACPTFQRATETSLILRNSMFLLKSLSDVNFSECYSIENSPKKFCGYQKASKFVTANF